MSREIGVINFQSVGSFPVEGAQLRLFPTGGWPRVKNAFHFGVQVSIIRQFNKSYLCLL